MGEGPALPGRGRDGLSVGDVQFPARVFLATVGDVVLRQP